MVSQYMALEYFAQLSYSFILLLIIVFVFFRVRASAVAERLWSAKDVKSSSSAIPRLDDQRCRMLKRGIRVEPVQGPGFCDCDICV